jgi:probable H4MPT-linked C1 transfer pathway protein
LETDGKVVQKVGGHSIYHEMWRDPEGLRSILGQFQILAKRRAVKKFDGIALTMTAEICDGFESKAEGVLSILEIVEESFRGVPVFIWTTRGSFASSTDIRQEPLQAAAANWLASAMAVALSLLPEDNPIIFADMGSTTTDIVTVGPGKVLARGRTDTERLLSGELLYTGILRTAVHSLIDEVYLDGSNCQIAHEYFAITADVYRLLQLIKEKDYTVPTPDGKTRELEACAKRLARIVGSELEELGMQKIYWIARMIMEKQTERIVDNILHVVSAIDAPLPKQLIMAGQGSFILREAARRLNLRAIPCWRIIPGANPQLATTSYAVAWLLNRHYQGKDVNTRGE